MWLITNFGFFSIVDKHDDARAGALTVRSRVKADLEGLRTKYLPSMGKIVANAGNDYKYRAKVPREALAVAMRQITLDVDYTNFKNSVAEEQGKKRANLYHKVWDVLLQLQDGEEELSAPFSKSGPAYSSGPKSLSFGGVLFDTSGRVLLRKPANEFDGYVWTFPKGRGERDVTPEETALREVLEETGYRATIVCEVPGLFVGGVTKTRFYVMVPSGEPQPFDTRETEEVKWAGYDEAVALISQTRNRRGRSRDLAVLKAAVVEWATRRAEAGLLPSADKTNDVKIIWREWERPPDEECFGHGVHFHDLRKDRDKDLVAWLEGYAWHHENPEQVEIYCIKPDSITTKQTLAAMKKRVEALLREKKVPTLMITRHIRAVPNA